MISELTPPAEYKQKVDEAAKQLQQLLAQGQPIALKKNSKHIFKNSNKKTNLDLRHFNQVLSIDTDRKVATVEGMTSFYDLVDATLAYGLMPQAVPELRAITVGGVIAGLGGQSSSFKFGLVHEMVTDFELITGTGNVVHCSPDSHADLYYMLPNSYGSLGYVLKCTIKLNEVAPFVHVKFLRFDQAGDFFTALTKEVQSGTVDFVEGVSFSPQEYILLLGEFTDDLPHDEILTIPRYEPFFQTVRNPQVQEKVLTIRDYIWRWDPDAFWATDQGNIIGAVLLHPLFRKTIGGSLLRSDRLIKFGQFRNRVRNRVNSGRFFTISTRKEALIQDAALPIEVAAEFDAWLGEHLHIYPLWYCPVKTTQPIGTYPLYQPGSEFVIDFGFYVSMALEDQMPANHYNLQIEKKLTALGGIKCLYSDTYYPPAEFWSIYDREKYTQVKEKYDPDHTFQDLYQKVITPLP